MHLLDDLNLHPLLRERITQVYSHLLKSSLASSSDQQGSKWKSFVLYLPTVNLRFEHNPAFALAGKLANYFSVPLLVLAIVTDEYHPKDIESGQVIRNGHQVFMTSRRLAFILEALSECSQKWKKHGAGVLVRVHGPKCRRPDHLSLSTRARAVVTDEPFVYPYLSLVQRVERACSGAHVPCFRVDGSTAVPPASLLTKADKQKSSVDSELCYDGVPSKAWIWDKKIQGKIRDHVKAAADGIFDAQPLDTRIDSDDIDFFSKESESTCFKLTDRKRAKQVSIAHNFPAGWCFQNIGDYENRKEKAPGTCPWTADDLLNITGGPKVWAVEWCGADCSVPPCTQTVGTMSSGMDRWQGWITRKGLSNYAKQRNDVRLPHAPSRMSCYLNLGIVSVFSLISEVLNAKPTPAGARKYLDEIVKWREFSYAHAFSRTDYHKSTSLPQWAVQDMAKASVPMRKGSSNSMELSIQSMENLEHGRTGDHTWDAMQQYLIRTGELHNNARMTWGKTLIPWGKKLGWGSNKMLRTLCYLNDRYALDGVSPPSYAGILWCMGWADKPSGYGAIKEKPASKYRVGPEGFREAEKVLLQSTVSGTTGTTLLHFHKRAYMVEAIEESDGKRRRKSETLKAVI